MPLFVLFFYFFSCSFKILITALLLCTFEGPYSFAVILTARPVCWLCVGASKRCIICSLQAEKLLDMGFVWFFFVFSLRQGVDCNLAWCPYPTTAYLANKFKFTNGCSIALFVGINAHKTSSCKTHLVRQYECQCNLCIIASAAVRSQTWRHAEGTHRNCLFNVQCLSQVWFCPPDLRKGIPFYSIAIYCTTHFC